MCHLRGFSQQLLISWHDVPAALVLNTKHVQSAQCVPSHHVTPWKATQNTSAQSGFLHVLNCKAFTVQTSCISLQKYSGSITENKDCSIFLPSCMNLACLWAYYGTMFVLKSYCLNYCLKFHNIFFINEFCLGIRTEFPTISEMASNTLLLFVL